MAQPHRGDRELIASRVPRVLYDELKIAAAERNLTMSDYVSDVMAAHMGHPELVRNLQEVLPETA